MALATDESELLWYPDDAAVAEANFTRVLAENGVATYADLMAKLAADPREFDEFYRKLIKSLKFEWQAQPHATVDLSRGTPFAQWFPGAEFNAPANCVDRWVDRGRGADTALLWEDEAGAARELTFAQLQAHVRACAAALLSLGIYKGQTVGLWMPMVPEAAIGLLAIGYIGAVAVPAFSGYGEQALATRLNDAKITVLIAADSLVRRGKRVSTLDTLIEAVAGVPSIKHVVLWTRDADARSEADPSDLSQVTAAAETVRTRAGLKPRHPKPSWRKSKPGIRQADETDASPSDLPEHNLFDELFGADVEVFDVDDATILSEDAIVATFAQKMNAGASVVGWNITLLANAERGRLLLPAITSTADPYLLLYTSGSTGKPKGVVHPHTGFPIKVALDQYLCFDVKPGDRMLWYTDMGWMMGPFLILGALLLGATVVLYDGTPDFPQPDRLWEVAAKHKVTHLGLAPTAVRALAVHGSSWPAKHDLSALRILGSTGEPWNSTPYKWFLEHIGRGRAPIINYSGGTEIGGGILGCFPTMPLAANAFHGPIPGMKADVVDANGAPVRGDVGELILRASWPGMTQSLWAGSAAARDDDRYLATYWRRLPDCWTHGDWAEVEEVPIPADRRGAMAATQTFWYIRGRSDDTINVAGKRVGPAEFESVLCSHARVREAAAIAVPDAVKGDVVVCLVVARIDAGELEALRKELFAQVDHELGHALRPKAIKFVDELPKTRNGKVMRRLARAKYLQLPELGDLSGLENPSALEAVARAL